MADALYPVVVDVAKFEDLDAQLVPYACALALAAAAGPLRGKRSIEELDAVRHQVTTASRRAAGLIAGLRGTALFDWPLRGDYFVEIAAALAVGWLGERAKALAGDMVAAIDEVDRVRVEHRRQMESEAAAWLDSRGVPAPR